jgi:hypothetical protein
MFTRTIITIMRGITKLRGVLVVEEAGVSGENHRPWASNW